MGRKIWLVGLTILAVGVSYLLITIVMPVLTDFASTANATITASSNWSDYPGAQGTLLAAPWWLYFAPAIVGGAAIVFVLRSK